MLVEAIVFFTVCVPDVLDTIEGIERKISELRLDLQRMDKYSRVDSWQFEEVGELNERVIELWTMTNFVSLIKVISIILNLFAFLNCWILIFRSKYFKLKGAKLRKSLWE